MNRNSRRNRLNQRSKNDTFSRVIESAKEVEDLVNSKLDGSSNSNSKSKAKYKRVAVGGTFDKFHYGHRSLIAKAFEIGENVEIGVTSNVFAGKKEGDIDSCNVRMANLNEFLGTKYKNFHISRFKLSINSIKDKYY